MKKIAYLLVALVAIAWLGLKMLGMITAFSFGLVGLAVIAGFGFFLFRAATKRAKDK